MTFSPILDANAYRPGDGRSTPPAVARREGLLAPTYRLFYREPVEPVRGLGARLWDTEGTEYLDVYNNVASVGHCHPRVVAAIAEQAATLNTHTRYLSGRILDYTEDLLSTMPASLDRALFACTGSEANDLAVRMARTFTGGTGIIVTAQAYHGNTELVTGISPSLGAGAPLGPDVWAVRSPVGPSRSEQVGRDFAAGVQVALDAMAERGVRVAALIVDTVFSSDGVYTDPPGFLREAVELVRRAGGVLIADEVQPGFARTGSAFWGFARHGLEPEIVTLGKPMGNGYPVSAVIAERVVFDAFAAATPYFNTFGGANVAIAAAQAVLDVIRDEGLQEHAAATGAAFRRGLAELRHDAIVEIRGDGLFTGLELSSGSLAADVVNGLRDRGVLTGVCGPTGATLKLRPPLVFSGADADRLLTELDAVLTAFA